MSDWLLRELRARRDDAESKRESKYAGLYYAGRADAFDLAIGLLEGQKNV